MATVQVRYIVNDVDAAIAFYCQHLGFAEVMHPAPAFAMLTRGDLRLVLSAPNPAGGGGQSMPDGRKPEPGGWNRFGIDVSDLAGAVESLRKAGIHFRNEIVTGVGGKQILVEDPSGNPIELFEPTRPEARLESPTDFKEFYRLTELAWNEFSRGNPEPAKSLYSHREDVTLANPFGPAVRGWKEVSRALEYASSRFREGEFVGAGQIAEHATAGLACLVDLEHWKAKIGERKNVEAFDLRVTTILRREGDDWKIVHRHADPITTFDPSGPLRNSRG